MFAIFSVFSTLPEITNLTTSPTSEKLKAYTRSNHQELEKLLVEKIRNIRTEAEYVELLQLFYNYFGALEAQIEQYIGTAELTDHFERRKASSLRNDISALGAAVNPTIQKEDVPRLNNIQQAFGALYVIEGSTLGGPHISKMIRKQLDNNNDAGLSFFNSYGEHTQEMWLKFKDVLDRQAQNDDEQHIILESADRTFLKFKSWIEKQTILN